MQKNSFLKSAILAIFLCIMFLFFWEFNAQRKGLVKDFEDDSELWSNNRAKVYLPSNKAVVFIGSSRIRYDLDIPTWEKFTHLEAIQLGMTGSSPLPILHNLAEDPKFKGKLIMDVTEFLLFNAAPLHSDLIIKQKPY